MPAFFWRRLKTSNSTSLPIHEMGTYPSSSTIGRFTPASRTLQSERSVLVTHLNQLVDHIAGGDQRTPRPFCHAAQLDAL